jgi:hypothetical protein
MSPKQFAIRYVFGVFALLALIGLFNRIVDPFWYYRDIEIQGFNVVKTKFERYERHVKPALLMRDQPEAIILGSSFSEIGFDPTNPLFTDHGRLKNMNFALSGAQWDMVQCEFEFAVSHAPIKRALVGFTPGNLPLADCAKNFSSIGQVSSMQLLFSDSALQASIDTIRDQNKTPSHTREGMYFMPHSEAAADNHFREFFLQRIKEYQQINKGGQCLKPTEVSDTQANLALGQSLDLSGLQRMIRTAKNHGLELVLYAYPSHAYMLELLKQCGDQDTKWQAMKQISGLIDAESAKGGRLHAYQFYGYNNISAEAIGATPAKYWYDPMHFNSQMGNIMLSDMFSGNSPKFGRSFTSSSIDADYQNFLQGRTEYLLRYPEFQAEMQKLLPQN